MANITILPDISKLGILGDFQPGKHVKFVVVKLTNFKNFSIFCNKSIWPPTYISNLARGQKLAEIGPAEFLGHFSPYFGIFCQKSCFFIEKGYKKVHSVHSDLATTMLQL